MADFVRGDPYKQHPKAVADGIKLHRFIDSYVDAMPEVKQCQTVFRQETRRVSGIALDMAWDHFLARHWQLYHQEPLVDFVRLIQPQVQAYQHNLPDAYRLMSERMWQQEWLLQYQEKTTLERALTRMAERRPRLYQLANTPHDIFQHYERLEQSFHVIYPQLQQAAQGFQPPLQPIHNDK
ncbi:ACP phosphodiesterase [Photobacterium jeanii]|nr:ACP phosphodiesterase [Photobacterium jeanii]